MRNKKQGTLGRLIKTLFEFYPVLMPLVIVFILMNAVVSSIPAIFMQNIIALVEQSWQSGDWPQVAGQITKFVGILVVLYMISLMAGVAYTQMMAVITQGTLKKLREKMFNGMQNLPVKYFDTHNHGDIMSYYTNDIDTLRQMVSQSFPQLMISFVTVVTVFGIMIYYSVWMTLVVLVGVIFMVTVTKDDKGSGADHHHRTSDGVKQRSVYQGSQRRAGEKPVSDESQIEKEGKSILYSGIDFPSLYF